MMTTKFMDFDHEEHRRSMDRLLEESGGTKGYIGHVTLGPPISEARPAAPPRIVKVPPLRAPVGFDAGAGGSHTAWGSPESWGIRRRLFDMQSYEVEALLEKIHRYHLDALAVMGKGSVGRHARGMVFAGYAYGMLDDPVSNIVANALWYDVMSPPPPSCEDHQVKMLSAKAIFRMAWRSFNALLAFMRHYAPFLGTKEILSCLLQADGNLQQAIRLLPKPGKGFGHLVGAFRAAIKTVDLPNEMVREAHLSFVSSYDSARALVLSNPDLFSPSVLRCLSQNLSSDHHEHPIMLGLASTPTSSTSNLGPVAYRALRLNMHSLEEKLSLAIADKALQKLALQHGEPYELHMICGKNWVILPPESYYHINFLAAPMGCSNPPTLFFAEVRGVFRDVNDVTLCCPVTEKNGRCFVCDCNGVKLIHPADEEFNGIKDPFGDHLLMTDPTSEFGAPLNEDYIFFDINLHPEIATVLEANYSYMNEDQVDLSFMWFENYLP